MIRKWLTGLTIAATLQCAAAGLANASPSVPVVLAQDQGGVRIQQAGARNWVVEGLVVVALSGAALYAICKSSRRV